MNATCLGAATYAASYTAVPIEYTVVFKDWDGAILSEETCHYGDSILIPADPERPETDEYTYAFRDWTYAISPTVTGNITYTARYTATAKRYTVSFYNYDGTLFFFNTNYKWGDEVAAPVVLAGPAPDDGYGGKLYSYVFSHWSTDYATWREGVEDFSKVCAGDAVYYAKFEKEYMNYTITFLNWDGEVLSTRADYHYADKVVVPADPTRPADDTYAYVFSGWDTEVSGTVAGNAVYVATYEPVYIDYEIKFLDWDGSAIYEKPDQRWGDEIAIPADPERPADETFIYAFAGWDKPVISPCSGSAAYTATYTPIYIDYRVRFLDAGGEVLADDYYHYGESALAPSPAVLSDANYVFLRWDKPFNNITGHLDVNGVYAISLGNGVYKDAEGNLYIPDQDGDYMAEADLDGDGVYGDRWVVLADGSYAEVTPNGDGAYTGASGTPCIPDQDGDGVAESDSNGDGVFEGSSTGSYVPAGDGTYTEVARGENGYYTDPSGTPYIPDQDGDGKVEWDSDHNGIFDGSAVGSNYIISPDTEYVEVKNTGNGVYEDDKGNSYIEDQDHDKRAEPDTNGDGIYEGSNQGAAYIPDQDGDGKPETDSDGDGVFEGSGSRSFYVPSKDGGSYVEVYPSTIEESKNGSVSISPSAPTVGETVTITPKPDEGCTVGTVTVTDQNGNPVEVTDNGDGTYSYVQPEGEVIIEVTFDKHYQNDIPVSENGSVVLSPPDPIAGDTVTITPTPGEGCTVGTVTVTDQNGNPVEVTDNGDGTCSFVQPEGEVTIEVTFDKHYQNDIPVSENGSVALSPPDPIAGDTVTITPTPDEGCTVGTVTVTDQNGNPVEVTDNGDGTCSFVQPEGEVIIEVTFDKKQNTGGNDDGYSGGGGTVDAGKPDDIDKDGTVDDDEIDDDETPPQTGVTVPTDVVGGMVSIEPPNAKEGETVTITITPDTGYELDNLAVTDSSGNSILLEQLSGNQYSFIMPDVSGTVSVSVSFRMTAVNSAASCGRDGTCPLHGFTDVKAEEWYHDGVHYCLDTGLISGVTADSFLPEGGTLRTVVAAALWKLEGSPAVSYAADYSDVPDEGKYVEAIRWVASAGIMTGYGDGRFGLEDPITREQLAAVLCRYAAYKGYELSTEDSVDLNSYHDAPDISEWAVPAMQLACNAGLIQGTPEGNLIPLESTTRAQAATIFMRFRENVVN